MNILVACEESQAVTIELRKLGHNAFSCDIQECSGGYPEWHIQDDVFNVLNGGAFTVAKDYSFQDEVIVYKWDMMIAFPTCTYLTISANKWYKDQPKRISGTLVGYERLKERISAIKFFIDLYYCEIPLVAIENPVGVMSSVFRKPDQVLQPWMFGHGETKATCLWLKGLPKLVWEKENNLFAEKTASEGREQRLHLLPKTDDRAKLRSKTFPGIAKAMAIQWAGYAENKIKQII